MEEEGMLWCKADIDRLLRMCGIYEPIVVVADDELPFPPCEQKARYYELPIQDKPSVQERTKIQQARLAKGLKQNEIAHKLRLKTAVIKKFEAGEQQLSPETYIKLKRLLDVC